MDLAPFRAQCILFSWTAYMLGFGRPAWIIEAYAIQNVVCWLLLAWLLVRWIPPSSGRGLALWTACLFSHGVLDVVRGGQPAPVIRPQGDAAGVVIARFCTTVRRPLGRDRTSTACISSHRSARFGRISSQAGTEPSHNSSRSRVHS